MQKLNYIHNNPCQPEWLLAEKQEDYHYSSAAFYILDKKEFDFLVRFDEVM